MTVSMSEGRPDLHLRLLDLVRSLEARRDLLREQASVLNATAAVLDLEITKTNEHLKDWHRLQFYPATIVAPSTLVDIAAPVTPVVFVADDRAANDVGLLTLTPVLSLLANGPMGKYDILFSLGFGNDGRKGRRLDAWVFGGQLVRLANGKYALPASAMEV